MRLDLFLKKTLIIKQRAGAKELCEKGLVKVNGVVAKPSKELKVSDIIEIETIKGIQRYRVKGIPTGNVKKSETELYYTEIR
uniref:RNA-binding S4 domain-containing protein n=1 Tax=candidate division WOR-3 bacterium TaxID=2052148 RepID=A0A7C4TH78_UNCW3